MPRKTPTIDTSKLNEIDTYPEDTIYQNIRTIFAAVRQKAYTTTNFTVIEAH